MRESRAPASKNENVFFETYFLQPSQNTAPATQNARAQIRCWPQVKRNEKGKSALHPHEMQVSKMTYFLFFFATAKQRVYIYLVKKNTVSFKYPIYIPHIYIHI